MLMEIREINPGLRGEGGLQAGLSVVQPLFKKCPLLPLPPHERQSAPTRAAVCPGAARFLGPYLNLWMSEATSTPRMTAQTNRE